MKSYDNNHNVKEDANLFLHDIDTSLQLALFVEGHLPMGRFNLSKPVLESIYAGGKISYLQRLQLGLETFGDRYRVDLLAILQV